MAEPLPFVLGDPTQIQQVLLNFCVNARDAMPDGGHLTVIAEPAEVEEQEAKHYLEGKPGTFVRIEVTDTGTGIPPGVIDKIFEPFFTTKPTGKGTGLGLSTVFSIVKSHGGFVSVSSKPGVGTTFATYLPVAEVLEAEDIDVALDAPLLGNGEKILIVDDEPHILEVTAVVTDLSMPEMDGFTAIRTLRGQGLTLPIIASSGLGTDQAEAALDAGADIFLAKPYTAERLSTILYEVLHRLPTTK